MYHLPASAARGSFRSSSFRLTRSGTQENRRAHSLRLAILTLARFFTDPVICFVMFWLPEYLRKERHFDPAMVGQYASVPFVFGGNCPKRGSS
jgi:hypothetical protein